MTVVSGVGPVWIGFVADKAAFTPFVALMLASGMAALGWLAGLYVFRHPIREELVTIATRFRGLR